MSWLILYDDLSEHHNVNSILLKWLKDKKYSYNIQQLLDNDFYLKLYQGIIIVWNWNKAQRHHQILSKINSLAGSAHPDTKIFIILDNHLTDLNIGITLSNFSLTKLHKIIALNQRFYYTSFNRKDFLPFMDGILTKGFYISCKCGCGCND
jgi:hypothetical protein